MRTLRVRRDVGANGYTAALRAATVQVRGAVKMRENDIGEGAGNPTLARNAIPGAHARSGQRAPRAQRLRRWPGTWPQTLLRRAESVVPGQPRATAGCRRRGREVRG